ncbi:MULTISPECIES: hypothetical protein [unclassified Okeania]|uniref:hypothetical protein n=1 Tax=unclassified Okeania TaxID=2634635 RepID=UPI0013BF7666|nr:MULTISPECIES: hypothetical protein [unclassified Okeania]NEN90133.1 hypothetical protein [Okeania sp. SIO3H1]NET30198.1 hypothetical protein [Okeania sp. SIO1I7]NET46900.1 hypothetical protein [Okeania sp. SIO2B3]NET47070.1 hypothetical protein [Okeania sp. SIO2B3]
MSKSSKKGVFQRQVKKVIGIVNDGDNFGQQVGIVNLSSLPVASNSDASSQSVVGISGNGKNYGEQVDFVDI